LLTWLEFLIAMLSKRAYLKPNWICGIKRAVSARSFIFSRHPL
jgi:hypothetical protein